MENCFGTSLTYFNFKLDLLLVVAFVYFGEIEVATEKHPTK